MAKKLLTARKSRSVTRAFRQESPSSVYHFIDKMITFLKCMQKAGSDLPNPRCFDTFKHGDCKFGY
jgi:hypothetical protein